MCCDIVSKLSLCLNTPVGWIAPLLAHFTHSIDFSTILHRMKVNFMQLKYDRPICNISYVRLTFIRKYSHSNQILVVSIIASVSMIFDSVIRKVGVLHKSVQFIWCNENGKRMPHDSIQSRCSWNLPRNTAATAVAASPVWTTFNVN